MVPAAIVYAVALVWSGAEGISAKLVLKDLAQSCKAPLGEGFLSSVGYLLWICLLYTSPSPRDDELSRMPSSA